ncbi:MAG: hypothetical protein IIX54_05270 [Clostridia bacterium]|nr:hypothetical protein [Clostridia bacterium]
MKIETKDLITINEEDKQIVLHEEKCDKYDYLVSVACGAIGGVIDIFLVGAPGDSVLGSWTDKQVDNAVISFAKKMGWNPKKGNEANVRSAIGFLEHGKNNGNPEDFQGFKVNYDQRTTTDVGGKFTIAPNTHHMMSLAHSPDIIGLFFSILNQFTSTSSFIANGQLITIDTEHFQLYGGNLISKLFCGVANWFGHLMSDVAGSSGSHGRGTGIVMPFYELFGFCKFGKFSTNDGKKDLAEIAMQAFNQGYDFRFGLAQAIPVLITELSIRLIWALRQRFQYKKPLKECWPSIRHANLRMMLLVGNATLCVLDIVDAAARSGGVFLAFFMRLNLAAWYRLVMVVLKELFMRLGIAADMELLVESYMRINEALREYLIELETLDIELFKEETEKYKNFADNLLLIKDETTLTDYLITTYEEMGIDLPWKGDFDDFMTNGKDCLVFK